MSWYSGISMASDVVFENPAYPVTVEAEVLELVGLQSLNAREPVPRGDAGLLGPDVPGTIPAFLLHVRLGGYQEMNILTDGKTFWAHTNPMHTKQLRGWIRCDEVPNREEILPTHARDVIDQTVKEYVAQIRDGEDQ